MTPPKRLPPNSHRMETMRRLGVQMVRCDECKKTMRKPADPFEGPNVIWSSLRPSEGRLYYVCSDRCRSQIRNRIVRTVCRGFEAE